MIPFEAPDSVRAALAGIGRTEDVTLSPDGSRLGIAAFSSNKIHLFSIAISQGPDAPAIRISDYAVLTSDSLKEPHGLAFLGNGHIIVCNRAGDVCVFRIPPADALPQEVKVRPLGRISGQGFARAQVKTPGSVTAYETGVNQYRVFVCNDQWHFVSSHTIALGETPEIINEGILIENALRIPDGISTSPGNRWIAISNHVHGEVLVFENSRGLNRKTSPAARLGGIVCPHGVAFGENGDLYVADAASPYLHVFEEPVEGWQGLRVPTLSIRLLDNETFYTGRYASREGGVKGICVDRTTGVLITTHKLGILEFHDPETLKASARPVDTDQLDQLRRVRDADIARSKSAVLRRRWTLATRLRQEIEPVKARFLNKAKRIPVKLKLLRRRLINRYSRKSILDPSGPIVSLTTHSVRTRLVYQAIESIAMGTLKPGRIILWLSDAATVESPPATLQRLRSRGLEIKLTEDRGPHTKYYPYVEAEERFTAPLVTADDDVLYPRRWLEMLVKAHQNDPSVIHCTRARRMRLNPYHFEPYVAWAPCTTDAASQLHFITAVLGVIYPPAFLEVVKARGLAFAESSPTADDIWLTHVAYRAGFPIAQINKPFTEFSIIPGTQVTRLSAANVLQGANQLQLSKTFSPADRSALYTLQEKESLAS